MFELLRSNLIFLTYFLKRRESWNYKQVCVYLETETMSSFFGNFNELFYVDTARFRFYFEQKKRSLDLKKSKDVISLMVGKDFAI